MYHSHHPNRKNIRLPEAAYTSGNPFFITICTHNKHPRFRDYPKLAKNLTHILTELSTTRNSKLYAWCIMPEHVHLLIEDSDIQSYIRMAKGRLTPIARKMISGEKFWQRSFYDHAIRDDESLHTIAKYIWNNPVRRGLVVHPFQYAGSGSLVWLKWRKWFSGGG